MKFTRFEDIAAWQNARKLTRDIRSICKRSNVKRDFTWVDQISRACLSILANIAEGNDCSTNAEFIGFLGYAKRSSTEVRSHLYYGLDEGYITQEEFDTLADEAKHIASQIAKLMTYLRSLPNQTRK